MIIHLNNLSKSFSENNTNYPILSDINLSLDQKLSYGIIGSSGVGKTTLLNIIGQIDTPSSGHVSYEEPGAQNKCSQKFSYIFQEHNLLPELSVLENLILPKLIQGHNQQNAILLAEKLLKDFQMESLTHFFVSQLSGGQRQRIAVLRAITTEANFILADEPTANLDQENANLVVNVLLQAKENFGIGIILCSHNPEIYNKMERLIKIENNKIKILPS